MKPESPRRPSSRTRSADAPPHRGKSPFDLAALRGLSAAQVYDRVLALARSPSAGAARRAGLPAADAESVATEVAERAAGLGASGVAHADATTPILAWVRAAAWRIAMEHRRRQRRADPRLLEMKEIARRLRLRAQRRKRWADLASKYAGRLRRTQQVLLAAHLEGLSDDRIAQTTGLRPETVAERLWRIRRRLTNLAAGIDESPPAAVPDPIKARRTLRGDAAKVLRLRAEGRTYREMARILTRPLASVRSAVQRARRSPKEKAGS